MAAILLLAHRGAASTVHDHVDAFPRWSRHEVFTWDPQALGDSRALDLGEFDAVVIHYSLLVTSVAFVPPRLRDALRAYRGLKVQYVQDDYRQVDAIAAAMRDLGVRVLFCLAPAEQVPLVWSEERLPGVAKHTTLAGYVPDALVGRPVPPSSARPVDVGYRGREVPPWLGRLAREKVRIGRDFLARAADLGMRCDIAWREEDRLYGERWVRFLESCRVVLGTESAVSIVDFDGSIERRAREYISARPGATDDDVDRDVLAPHEGNVVLQAVSPRVFEAAALGTGLVLFPGRYSGVLEPWRHYVPLAEDFSNVVEVARLVSDDAFLAELTGRVERDIVLSGRYSLRSMVRAFDEAIEGQLGAARPRPKAAFALARLERSEPLRELPETWRRFADGALRVRNAVLLAALAAGPVLTSPALLRLASVRLAHRGGDAPPWGRFGADLVRLALLRSRARRPRRREELRCELLLSGDQLRAESVPRAAAAAAAPLSPAGANGSTPHALVWDCRAVGGAAGVNGPLGLRLAAPVGVDGVHVFATASWLAATAPSAWRAALSPLLRAAGVGR